MTDTGSFRHSRPYQHGSEPVGVRDRQVIAEVDRTVDALAVRTWRRVDPGTGTTVIGFVFMVVGVGIAVSRAVSAASDVGIGSVISLAALFAVCWCTAIWRIIRIGIYVSPERVRLVYAFRSLDFAWSETAEITSRRAETLGLATNRDAIWVVKNSGERIETPVQRRSDQTVTFFALRKNGGPVLGVQEYDRLLELLRTCRYQALSGR